MQEQVTQSSAADILVHTAFTAAALPERVRRVCQHIINHEPPYLVPDIRLKLPDAELACAWLKTNRAMNLQPYDIVSTIGVWQGQNSDNIPYTQVACKELVTSLARQNNCDSSSPEGFKEILPSLAVKTFREFEINQQRTRLGGLIDYYRSSPSAPILELISNDSDFIRIKRMGITGADFPEAPNYYWHTKENQPTSAARQIYAKYVELLIKQYDLSISSDDSMVTLYKHAGNAKNQFIVLNFWQTNIRSALSKAYGGSTFLALVDYIKHSSDYRDAQKVNFLDDLIKLKLSKSKN